MMRLTWRDGWTTLLMAAAGVIYGLWVTGTAMTGTSTRVAALIIFAIGFAGCVSNQSELAVVFGVRGKRPPMAYVVVATLTGMLALVAGIVAITAGNSAMLATLVVAMGALWIMATARHAMTRAPAAIEEPIHAPTAKAA